ncbi:39S ribosomal protein L18, mitochondrial-like [Eriocheir sinensis]|uniref:39S ribosomal protein L18, mitochondrial-like n=1 Tax=Eriocheir sinensis TaxID=95602 RepID=UPI0021C78C3C|nr:39S ribosomal protein L18, mitochondrial-like [Eriocheir sinensis]
MQALRGAVWSPLAGRASAAHPRLQAAATGMRHISNGENDAVNPNFVNRNPRNMEMLRLARKPEGWDLEASSPLYWYKLMLEQSNRHSTGWVEHHTGTTVVSASTREWAIKQQLYSTTDTSAIRNIGHVLARRCLESGITEVYTELDQYAESSAKVKLFLSALREGGMELKEPRFIHERAVTLLSERREVLPWNVQEEEVVPKQTSPSTSSSSS